MKLPLTSITANILRVDDAMRAIAEPRRREIVRLVWQRELPAGEIAAHFEVTRTAISQHLRVLKDVGLVVERREGARRLYRAVPQRVEEIRRFLESFWDDQLATLKVAAEREERMGTQRWPDLALSSRQPGGTGHAEGGGRPGRSRRRPS
jgi:DNA-binding transcriptional ArsR family regulator